MVELVEGDDLVVPRGGRRDPAARHAPLAEGGLSGQCVDDAQAGARSTTGGTSARRCSTASTRSACSARPRKAGEFSDEDLETLRLLAPIIAIPLHRTRSFPRPRYDNTHDALTGLSTAARSRSASTSSSRAARATGSRSSLAMLDLDGFNTANDRFGEAAGDELLRTIATILNKHTRVMDACFRLGGDEFAIVMPGTALDGAKILAERFRPHIADANLCDGTVTASFGVVEAARRDDRDADRARGRRAEADNPRARYIL